MITETLERRVRVIPATRTTGRANVTGEKKRVAAYCRVSTDSEEQLNSYEAQKSYYLQKIEETPDWEMAGLYADEGISGTSRKKRTEFNKMLTACKRGRIDMIITKSLSRFARNTVDCLETVRMLKGLGIGVFFEKENINTLTESSEFLITLFSGFAQAESESLSKNVSWGIRKGMESGKVHFQNVMGYRKGPDGQPEIVPEEAKIVRKIYQRYLDGCSLPQIKQELEAEHILTTHGLPRWSPQGIRNILRNEKYIGDALLQKTYITDCISKRVKQNRGELPMYYVENNHPAIIPREIFAQVQEDLSIAEKVRQPRFADGNSLSDWQKRLTEVTQKQTKLLDLLLENMDDPELNAKMKALTEEKQALKQKLKEAKQKESDLREQETQRQQMWSCIQEHAQGYTEFDDELVRQVIEKITVVDGETIRVKFRGESEVREGKIKI